MDSSHRRGHAKKEKMTHPATCGGRRALPSGPEHGVVRGARGPGGGPVRRRVLRVVCAPGTVPWGDVRAHGKVARRRPTGMAPSRIRDQRRTGHRRRGPRGSGDPSNRSEWRTRGPGGRPSCRRGRTAYREGTSSRGEGRSPGTDRDRVARAARRQADVRHGCRDARRSLGRVGRVLRAGGDRVRRGRPRRSDRPARRARPAGGLRWQGRFRRGSGGFRRARVRRRVRPSQP